MGIQNLEALKDAEAFLFDVFGTVVDWRSAVVRELSEWRPQPEQYVDWYAFADEWRAGYYDTVQRVAKGEDGPSSTDDMHRMLLDNMLTSSRWSFLDPLWSEKDKQHLNWVWHRLHPWPDSVSGLEALKIYAFVASLSNGNIRLQLDLKRYGKLPWDITFSTELFDTFKPNPKAYLEAARHLSIPPNKCVMVAAHLQDLIAASNLGMKTVYIHRDKEDARMNEGEIKTNVEGGQVDVVVRSLDELAVLVAKAKA